MDTTKKRPVLLKKRVSAAIPFLGLVIVLLVMGIGTGGKLFSTQNLNTILDQCYTIAILSVGCSFIYAHGGFDLAVGAVYGLAQIAAGFVVLGSGMDWTAIPLTLVASVACGFVTGYITVKLNLPAFISSLCMQFLARGIITSLITNNLVLPNTLGVYNNWALKAVILLIVLVVAWLLMSHSVFGKQNKAVGENPVAAEQSGVNNRKVRLLAYIFCYLLVGIAAFFAMCRTGTVAIQSGSGYELDVIIAIALGGMSLNGGARSTVRAPILGAIITTVLGNGLVMMGVNYKYIDAVSGIIFLVVVAVSYKRAKDGLLPR